MFGGRGGCKSWKMMDNDGQEWNMMQIMKTMDNETNAWYMKLVMKNGNSNESHQE